MAADPRLDVALLRVLDALLRTESTVRAARALHVTQSAVSHALRRLRDVLGDPLFVVVGRKLVATERARALGPAVAEALAAVDRVLATGDAFDPRALRATFRIVAADNSELIVLPRLLDTLAVEAPGVDLLTLTVGDALEDVLEQGDADLAIAARFRERAGLLHRALFDDVFVCALRADAGIARMTLRRFVAARHVLVSPRGLPGGFVDDHLAARGESRRVVLRTPSFQTALALAARTDLVVTLPRRVAEEYARTTPLLLLAPPIELPALRVGLLFPASRRADVAHRWLRERIATLFAPRGR
jgi:DNA-binding transcriptional LysR family regulator